MKHIIKHILIIACSLVFTSLTGCTFKSGDELLQTPKPSSNYESLQKQINSITSNGAIAVSPQTGENRNTVQLMDLDLDGEDEAVAFFCETKNPDKFHVYVFKRKNDEYVCVGEATSTAAQINSVSYPALSKDGKKGILISWKLSGDNSTSGITVCSFLDGKLKILLEDTYQAFTTSDLDNNGTDDIILFKKDDNSRRFAQLYISESDENKIEMKGEAMLSPETQSIVSLKKGLLRSYQPAIFAESKVEISSGLMTDIFVYDQNGFRNITLDGDAKYSTYRPVSVPSTDINNDMVVEVPLAVSVSMSSISSGQQNQTGSSNSNETSYLLDWYAYSTGDAPVRVCTTYQNVSENWQFLIPDNWRGKIKVEKNSTQNQTETKFIEVDGQNTKIELLTIHRLTGDMRNYYASQDNMIELARTPTEIYTASIPEQAYSSQLKLTDEQVKEKFSIISQSWSN